MKTIEELALEVAENMGLVALSVFEPFATKLIAAWQSQQESVGVFADVNRGNDRESSWRKYRTTDSLKVAEHTVARCSGDPLELKIVPLYAAEQE